MSRYCHVAPAWRHRPDPPKSVCARHRQPVQRTFTLIELLVVVAVSALLVSILLPTLVAARERARRLKCASNLHQIAIGWLMYTDHELGGAFPYYLKNIQWFYGGKMDRYQYPQLALDRRPVNWYVGSDPYGNHTAEIFHCPFDRGAEFLRSPRWYHPSSYDYYGNSYPTNGEFFRLPPKPRVVRDSIRLPLSLVVLVGDHQMVAPGSPDLLARWHDEAGLRMNVAFLDGHAEFMEFEYRVWQTAKYSFLLEWQEPKPPGR